MAKQIDFKRVDMKTGRLISVTPIRVRGEVAPTPIVQTRQLAAREAQQNRLNATRQAYAQIRAENVRRRAKLQATIERAEFELYGPIDGVHVVTFDPRA